MQDRIQLKNTETGETYPTPYDLVKEIHFGMEGEIEKVIIAKYLPDGEWKFVPIPGDIVEMLKFSLKQEETKS